MNRILMLSALLLAPLGLASAQSTGQSAGTRPVNQMTTLPHTGTSDRMKSTQALQSTLTELQALQLQTKQAHWNVSGALYYPLHELLQEHYEIIAKHADDVAERLLAIGSSSDGRAPVIVGSSNLPEIPGGFIDDARVLNFFSQQYVTVGGRLFKRIDDVEKVDPTTANLLQEVEHDIEKFQWQMRAHLQPTNTDPNGGAFLNSGAPVLNGGK